MVKSRRFKRSTKSKRPLHHKRHKHHSTHRRKVKRHSKRGTKRRQRTKRVKRGGARKYIMNGGMGGNSLFVALDPVRGNKVFAIGFTSMIGGPPSGFPKPTFYNTQNTGREDIRITTDGSNIAGGRALKTPEEVALATTAKTDPLLVKIILEAKRNRP